MRYRVWLQKSGLSVGLCVSLVLFLGAASCPSGEQPGISGELAIADGNTLLVVDVANREVLHRITRYQEVEDLAYQGDGQRLAVAVCAGDRVVQLETTDYSEQGDAMTAASCPWDLTYSHDGRSLAATLPSRINDDPMAAMTGKLKIIGDNPWDQVIGRPLPALAYRPGDRELAIATPQGLRILAPAEGYRQLAAVPELDAVSLAYTTDGSRLLAGTANGLVVLDAAAGYAEHTTDGKGTVSRVVVDPTGRWLALVGRRQVSIRRAPDLVEVKTLTTTAVTDADFAPDGSGLAVAEADGQVRLFRAPRWHELSPIAAKRPRAVAFRPGGGTRIPVLFVHGHLRDSGSTWFESSRRTYSVVDALAVNPQLPIDAFFLELPTHVKAVPNRSISDDALDVLAAIEGGADSQGRLQVGILNLSAYQEAGKVAIVASSQGAVSSRYYIKDHMGTRHGGPVTVSEFVLLAAPNHGIGAGLTRIMCGRLDEPDRARRQLCGGRTKADQDDCGQCSPMPPEFTTNQHGDSDFFTELNGRPLSATCSGTNDPREAPHSRGNTNPEGVLYVNLYAGSPPDTVVGGDTQSRDCVGRRLARLLAADVANRVVNDVPLPIHGNFPHHWRTICLALRTVEKHDAPSDNPAEQLRACQSLVRPPSG